MNKKDLLGKYSYKFMDYFTRDFEVNNITLILILAITINISSIYSVNGVISGFLIIFLLDFVLWWFKGDKIDEKKQNEFEDLLDEVV